MARTLDCAVAPWGLEEAALVGTSETVVPVACNSVALAEGGEVVLRLPVLKGPPLRRSKRGGRGRQRPSPASESRAGRVRRWPRLRTRHA
eukprot:52404-Alexandrium_andersonii.AAC.1